MASNLISQTEKESAASEYIANPWKQIHFISGATWAQKAILERANKSFEDWHSSAFKSHPFNPENCDICLVTRFTWDSAYISSAKTLAEKDAEIESLRQIKSSMSDVIEAKTKRIKELELQLAEAEQGGIRWCIDKLRQEPPLSSWSHSRDLNFAAVELSDFLLIQYRKSLASKKSD